MVVLLGQALREATDALAANLAVAMQRQLKQLPPFLRDAVLPKLAAAGNGVMGGVQQAMEDIWLIDVMLRANVGNEGSRAIAESGDTRKSGCCVPSVVRVRICPTTNDGSAERGARRARGRDARAPSPPRAPPRTDGVQHYYVLA